MLFVKEFTDIPIMQWRKENTQLILRYYIPWLFKQLEATGKYQVKLKYTISSQYSTEGFHPENILILLVTIESEIGKTEFPVKIVVPNEEDIIYLSKPHILPLHIVDNGYYIKNGIIRFYKYQVDEDGILDTTISPIPLYKVLAYYDKLQEYLGDYEIVEQVKSDYELKGYTIYPSLDQKHYLIIKTKELQPIHQLIGKSFTTCSPVIRKPDENLIKKALELEAPYDLQFVENLRTYKDILFRALKDYNRYAHYTEIHIKFKRVRYLEYLLDPLARKIAKIKKIVTSTSNKHSLKQKIPHDIVTQYAKQVIQYLDLTNPLEEIAYKSKITLNLDNPPAYLRDTHITHASYICQLDTPDNDNVGKVRHLALDAKLDIYGRFYL